jgi:hypothetical protein
MNAPNLVGAVVSIVSSAWITSGPALAYHGSADHGGGAPLGAILPIVIVVVVGVIALSIWKPQARNAKLKKRERTPGYRALHKRHKRGR